MAFGTGERLNFNTLINPGNVPVYKLGQQGNQHDPDEEAAVKAAFELLAKKVLHPFCPAISAGPSGGSYSVTSSVRRGPGP